MLAFSILPGKWRKVGHTDKDNYYAKLIFENPGINNKCFSFHLRSSIRNFKF